MTIFFVFIFGLYYLLTVFLIIGLKKAMAKNVGDAGAIPTEKISVIVAFKNEEHNLVALIQSIDAQNYPKECFEVILVDDHSNDRSVLVVREAIKGLSNFKLITTHWQDSGKKKALTNGVNQVSAGVIVTTDADCIVPPNWLTRINETFYRYQPTLIFGGVKIIDRKSLFSSLQQLEFSSLIASGAATHSFGKTSMCNAANLAFSKAHFDKVGGYEGNFEIASGDDEFLMRKMLTSYPGSVVFMNHQDAIVSTQPQPTIKAFIHQRLRWAAKLPHNPSLSTKVLAWYVILFQSSYLLLFGLTFTNSISLELSITLFGGKLLLEFLFLRKAVSFLQTKFSFISFFILQFLYPLYVVYVGIASNFISYQWKGNRYKA
jgi:biofilm PGA synthesis N-glycosyltransferase PgaC